MTMQPNANWTASNDAAVKQPIYAVNINGTSEWFIDYDLTSGQTGNHYKRLVSITGVPTKFEQNPLRPEASIGGFTFKLLNPSKTEIFTWWALDELYQKPVIVKAGYLGDDWSDFEVIATSYLNGVTTGKGNTSMTFSCQDLQSLTNETIFTTTMFVTGTADSGGGTTLVDSDLSVKADDFWNSGEIVITGGTGDGQTRTVSDFTSSTGTVTVSVAWDTNPDSTSTYGLRTEESLKFKEKNPITMWMEILMSTGNGTNWSGAGTNYDQLAAVNGLGISYTLIDIEEAELIRDDFLTTWQGDWKITDDANAKAWFNTEIFIAFALRPVIKATGLMSIRTLLPPMFGYLNDNDMASLMTDSEIIDIPKWKMEYRNVVNQILFSWGWDGESFTQSLNYADNDSVSKYGERKVEINSKGMQKTLDGTNLTNIISNRYFQRYGNEPKPITLKTSFNQRTVEAADQVFITSSQIPNLDDSNLTWTARGSEVTQVTPDFAGGNININVIDISTGGKKYGVINTAGASDHAAASATDKITYCYVSPTIDGTNYYIL